jgi:hypothetical protein
MKPIDFRMATFDDLQLRIAGGRAEVLAAWRKHGTCTTQELAELSGISILTLRPRTTELFQLGFVCLADHQPAKGEGIYRARTDAEIIAWCSERREFARERQAEFALP